MGISLRVKADCIKAIEKNHPSDAVRCAFEILNTWRQNLEGNPDSMDTYDTLREVFIKLNRNDLVKVLSSSE